jgi:1,4-alpha-glucan branching enzyme
LVQQPNGDIEYREWAPGAESLSIFGDFNEWKRDEYSAKKNQFGVFEITLKANEKDGKPLLKHGDRYKIQITCNGEKVSLMMSYNLRSTLGRQKSRVGPLRRTEQNVKSL